MPRWWPELDLMEWLVIGLIVVCVAVVLGVVLGVAHNAEVGGRHEYGTVVSLRYRAAYTSVQTSRRSAISTPVYHPESWSAVIGEDGERWTVDIDQTTFHEWRRGQRVENPLYRGEER